MRNEGNQELSEAKSGLALGRVRRGDNIKVCYFMKLYNIAVFEAYSKQVNVLATQNIIYPEIFMVCAFYGYVLCQP